MPAAPSSSRRPRARAPAFPSACLRVRVDPMPRPSADLQAPIDFERPTADAFGTAGCPHMAILLDSTDDVAPALASFYNLGLRRNAWLRSEERRVGKRVGRGG